MKMLIPALLVATTLAGCVVAPAQPAYAPPGPGYSYPPAVIVAPPRVYVEPPLVIVPGRPYPRHGYGYWSRRGYYW
ncbi:hypothetical protein [Accumulibacter sp.]|uniref:hypothetical protein n=1 Tax=Accumulibacter sp. TaxID=2053492 RepID=UPI0025B9F877|nr:hypothetical protein [Accumulibacter sp.]